MSKANRVAGAAREPLTEARLGRAANGAMVGDIALTVGPDLYQAAQSYRRGDRAAAQRHLR